MSNKDFEIRAYEPILASTEETAEGVIEGMPIVYNSETTIGGVYTEVILPDALQPNAITKNTFLTYNHDSTKTPLARVRNGSLTFENSETGLKMRAKLNLDRTDAKDLYLAIQDDCIDKMSFAFKVADDDWDFSGDMPKRTIKSISYVHEVSAVDTPAYDDTTLTIVQRAQEQVETALQTVEAAKREAGAQTVETEEDSKGMQEEALALAKAKAKARLLFLK